ncbi:hypothetical protein LVJ82_03960 [Vitreoscilla massiliensis]|uniref:Uncharacterized protein n=1 Tax=Vitreoscilla massiliensis TaxID=1689272 RepID=A0ABY4E3S1_9NEIS|nr:hypothetical protein [Vitreoscilla massiliensis]UOO90152.1 hypothetical protein LVJ82_03960 [Vitreoscilla massiliensis]
MQHKSLLLLSLMLSCLPAFAKTPDASDQGQYVLLNIKTHQPSAMYMRFSQKNGQWQMDQKQGQQSWQASCRQQEPCRLHTSEPNQVRHFITALPKEWQQYDVGCIHNQAFAFCRVDHQNRRAYWFIGLVAGKPQAIPVNRIN